MSLTDTIMNKRRRFAAATAVALATGLAVFAAHAATTRTIGVGALPYDPVVDGPATVTVRTLTIAPGEVLGWHAHPGLVYVVVATGTLTVEDGCGGETVYTQGQAFIEPANRIHRGKNLTGTDVVTVQTFIMAEGTPISESHATPGCGVPQHVDECKVEGWRMFNHPTFYSQGECVEFVLTTN